MDYRTDPWSWDELSEWDYPPEKEISSTPLGQWLSGRYPTMDLPVPGDLYTRPSDPLSPGGLGPASGPSTRARVRQPASGLFTGPNSFGQTMVEMAKSLPEVVWDAVDLPAAAVRGEVDPMSEAGIGRAADLAGTVTLGGGAVPRAVPKGSIRSGLGASDPEKIVGAAVSTPDGQILRGPSHLDIIERHPWIVDDETAWTNRKGGFEDGFVTNSGRFVSREEAADIAGIQTGFPALSDDFDGTLSANRSAPAGAAVLFKKDLTAAIRVGDQIYAGPTHGDIMSKMPPEAQKAFWDQYSETNEGFVNRKTGQYMDRNEAGQELYKSGQMDETLSGDLRLSSEDLDVTPWDEDIGLYSNRSAAAGAVPIFSRMEREAAALPQPKAQGQQYEATLRNKGVPAEELDWTGVADWLKERGTLPVTKEELLAQIGKAQTQVGIKRLGNPKMHLDDPDMTPERADELGINPFDFQEPGAVPKYSRYQLPGGENYREVLLTLPPTKNALEQWNVVRQDGHIDRTYSDQATAQSRAEEIGGRVSQGQTMNLEGGFRSSHWDEPNVLAHMRVNDRFLPDAVEPAGFTVRNRASGNQGPRFATEQEALDYQKTLPMAMQGQVQVTSIPGRQPTTGTRVLFAEEIQADWPQKANAERKREVKRIAAEKGISEKEAASLVDPTWGYMSKDTSDPRARVGPSTGGHVPDYPFKKTWPDLVLKRLVADAVEGGYDAVAWTDGATQLARYPEAFGKVVSQIDWGVVDGARNVRLQLTNGGEGFVRVDREGKILGTSGPLHELSGKHLEDAVGKEMAKMILDQESGKLTPDQYVIGGEKMANFYDTELPRRAKKLFGKWGAVVEDSHFPAVTRVPEGSDLERYATPEVQEAWLKQQPGHNFHILRITPEMRAAVQSEGLPLFANRSKVGAAPLAMDRESRMARAAEMGFNVDAYRGSTYAPDDIPRKASTLEQMALTGEHYASTPEFANIYADPSSVVNEGRKTGNSPNVTPVKIRDQDIIDASVPTQVGSKEYQIVLDLLKGTGRKPYVSDGLAQTIQNTIDSVSPQKAQTVLARHGVKVLKYNARVGSVAPGGRGMNVSAKDTAYLVLDPSSRRSPAATFDPAKSDSADILAANRSKAAGAGVMAGERNQTGTLPMSSYDQESGRVNYLVDRAEKKLAEGEPPVEDVPMDRIQATQAWIDPEQGGGGDPVIGDLTEYPVFARTADGVYHILDGHHRTDSYVKDGDKIVEGYVIDVEGPVTGGRFKRGGRVPNTKAELFKFLQHRASGGTVTINGEVTEIYQGKKKTMRGRPLSQNVSNEGFVNRKNKVDPRPLSEILVDPTQYMFDAKSGFVGGGDPNGGAAFDLFSDEPTVPQNGDLWTDGLIYDPTPGRTDRLPTDMPAESYVIPADIVSSLGQGNTLAGGKILDAMFGRHANVAPRAEGGSVGTTVPVIVAGGEYTVSPDKVQSMGGGDHKKGHQILDSFVKKTRLKSIRHLKKLPGPAKS